MSKVITTLIQFLNSPNDDDVVQAMLAIGAIGEPDKTVIALLKLRAIYDRSPRVREAAFAALDALGFRTWGREIPIEE